MYVALNQWGPWHTPAALLSTTLLFFRLQSRLLHAYCEPIRYACVWTDGGNERKDI